MGAEAHGDAIEVAAITREFPRVRKGYAPDAVDRHLAEVRAGVQALVEARDAPDESLDLVLKATRRSVDEALQDARDRAESIVAEARAEAEAVREEAAERCRDLDAESRERYAEMVRLTDAASETLADLDQRISERQGQLRSVATELVQLAGRLAPPARDEIRRVAAFDAATEIVMPARREHDD